MKQLNVGETNHLLNGDGVKGKIQIQTLTLRK